METFDLPSPWTIGTIAGLVLLVATSCIVGVPLGIWREAWRRNRSTWNAAVPTTLTKGAYRGMMIDLPIRVQIPRIVVVASAASLYIAVPMVVALPFVFVGLCSELAHGTTGPALSFGVEEALLTMAIVGIGVTLTRRSSEVARATRVVAYWELAHAAALGGAVAMMSAHPRNDAWDVLGFDGAGVILAPYAALAALHALLLLAAAGAQARVADRALGAHVTLRACA